MIYSRDDEIPNKLAQRTRANPPPAEVNKDIPSTGLKSEDCHNKRIKGLLSEIEEKVFQGKVKMYQLFRSFDVDGDGYVSHQDFDNFVRSIKVDANKKEVASIMKLIDSKNKGYLTFNEFSKTFSPNMSTELVKIELTDNYFPNLVPSDDVTGLNRKNQHSFNERIKKIREQFKPDPDQSK